jgi:hypothetical protein
MIPPKERQNSRVKVVFNLSFFPGQERGWSSQSFASPQKRATLCFRTQFWLAHSQGSRLTKPQLDTVKSSVQMPESRPSLILQVREGGQDWEQAQSELCTMYVDAIYSYLRRSRHTPADAEDLSQQTFLIAQQKLHQLREAERAVRYFTQWHGDLRLGDITKESMRGAFAAASAASSIASPVAVAASFTPSAALPAAADAAPAAPSTAVAAPAFARAAATSVLVGSWFAAVWQTSTASAYLPTFTSSRQLTVSTVGTGAAASLGCTAETAGVSAPSVAVVVVSWLPHARVANAITNSAFRSMKFLPKVVIRTAPQPPNGVQKLARLAER